MAGHIKLPDQLRGLRARVLGKAKGMGVAVPKGQQVVEEGGGGATREEEGARLVVRLPGGEEGLLVGICHL